MKKTAIITFLFLASAFASIAQVNKSNQVKPKPKAKKAAPIHKTVTRPIPFSIEQKVELTTDYGVIVMKLYNETPKHRDNFIKLVKAGFYDSLLFHRVIETFMIQGGDPGSKYSDTSASLGDGDVGYTIPAEFNPKLFHRKGALAAARDNNPAKASSGCQFYIVQGKSYTPKELEQIINGKNMSHKQEILYNLYQRDSVQAMVNELNAKGDKEALRKYISSLQPAADKEYEQKYPNATNVDMDQIEYYVKVGGTPQLDGDYTVFGEVISGWNVIDKIAAVATRKSDNRPLVNVRMKMRLIQ
ncbi:MAG: peptidylprolyl isomerase [Bacteroidota bacterium]|nr:peptidylprolyl isomerase [Bacteroidota bacterium]